MAALRPIAFKDRRDAVRRGECVICGEPAAEHVISGRKYRKCLRHLARDRDR